LTPVRCGTCKGVLDEPIGLPVQDRMPCPACGSTSRIFAKAIHGEVLPRGSLRARGKREGGRKPFVEIVSGADWSHKLRRWMHKLRIIDRERNRYEELVVDRGTGRVIHECKEPLSSHKGHGSDKEA
jgi:hypothetical protein